MNRSGYIEVKVGREIILMKPMTEVAMRDLIELNEITDETAKAYRTVLACLVNPSDSKHIEDMNIAEFSEMVEYWSSMQSGGSLF